jgi:hypothetical protein
LSYWGALNQLFRQRVSPAYFRILVHFRRIEVLWQAKRLGFARFGILEGGGAAVAGSLGKIRNAVCEMRNGKLAFSRCLILDVGLAAGPLWRVACNWWRVDADGDIGVPDWDVGFI